MNAEKQAELIAALTDALPTLRARLHLTQAELGKVIGVTGKTVYCIESGRQQMTWTMFLALVYAFSLHRAAHPVLNMAGISSEVLADLVGENAYF